MGAWTLARSWWTVAADAEFMAIFRGFQARARGTFVVESDREPRLGSLHACYRCEPVFERLIAWLRADGVRTLKPLRCLRKKFGSMVCATYGIHAASRALRHSAVGHNRPLLYGQPQTN